MSARRRQISCPATPARVSGSPIQAPIWIRPSRRSPTAAHIVLNANVKDTQTNVTIHTGQAYGIGIRNGPSQNALQQRFWHISYSNCEYGIYLAGGNADMRHINGGQSDFGIFIGGFTAEQSSIDYYESESDARGIESDGPLTLITNSRLSNGNQFGDGFWKFGGGMVNIQNSLLAFAPRANQVVVGTNGIVTRYLHFQFLERFFGAGRLRPVCHATGNLDQ